MNPQLKKFKVLTTWVEGHKVENLLEATLYLDEAFKFIDLLLLLDNNSFDYKVIEGFKGYTVFKEQENEFKDILLEVKEDKENVIQFFISIKYNEVFNVQAIDESHLKIEIK